MNWVVKRGNEQEDTVSTREAKRPGKKVTWALTHHHDMHHYLGCLKFSLYAINRLHGEGYAGQAVPGGVRRASCPT